MLSLPGRFVWDFWTLEARGATWLYALTAPVDPDPHTRHDRARVEVFESADLKDWSWRGVALEPGTDGAWDDLAIWTGSATAHPASGFVMLYTGRGRADGGRAQKIGLARSDDLISWTKHEDGPVIEADASLYRLSGRDGSTNWRDPWMEWCAEDGVWRAWITAQHPDGPVETAGTVALAESADLLTWEVRPPVVTERLSEHLEVPQRVAGGAGMLLNVYPHHVPDGGRLPRRCMSLLYRRDGDHYRFDRIVEDWPSDTRYILKSVRRGMGLCWLGEQEDGRFLGQISDPFPFDPVPTRAA